MHISLNSLTGVPVCKECTFSFGGSEMTGSYKWIFKKNDSYKYQTTIFAIIAPNFAAQAQRAIQYILQCK